MMNCDGYSHRRKSLVGYNGPVWESPDYGNSSRSRVQSLGGRQNHSRVKNLCGGSLCDFKCMTPSKYDYQVAVTRPRCYVRNNCFETNHVEIAS
ncbi:hypothetical protein TNCV_4322161 [Trichonephila clavipes]|uniref:Uncharacterized protein n=1 Tax=Trichonephila clavipes TaxID=2585209 RepID=A0A8X6SI01_TRICX|nr:hypothetical protein TNCV_4322161 [Trichonephila clavipes]